MQQIVLVWRFTAESTEDAEENIVFSIIKNPFSLTSAVDDLDIYRRERGDRRERIMF